MVNLYTKFEVPSVSHSTDRVRSQNPFFRAHMQKQQHFYFRSDFCSHHRSHQRWFPVKMKLSNLTILGVIFGDFITACAQKRLGLLMSFWTLLTFRLNSVSPVFYRPIIDYISLIYYDHICFSFFIVQQQNPPYFYFRLIWPSDLESASCVMLRTSIISTKFEVDQSHQTTDWRLLTFSVLLRYVNLLTLNTNY